MPLRNRLAAATVTEPLIDRLFGARLPIGLRACDSSEAGAISAPQRHPASTCTLPLQYRDTPVPGHSSTGRLQSGCAAVTWPAR